MAEAAVKLNLPEFLATSPRPFTGDLTLSGQIYVVRFVWANRVADGKGAWYLDLKKSDGTNLVLGIKVVLADDLWINFRHVEGLPPGKLRVVRPDGSESDPGLFDLAGEVEIHYVTETTEVV